MNKTSKKRLFTPNESQFLTRAFEAVETHLDDDEFGVEELAKILAVSRSQLHRLLIRSTKLSASSFIRQIRLHFALKLLSKGEYSTSEIAYQVGFGSPTYFTKCFRDYFDCTPSEIKNKTNKIKRKNTRIEIFYNTLIETPIEKRRLEAIWEIQISKQKRRISIYTIVIIFICIIISSIFIIRNHKKQQQFQQMEKSIAILPFEYLIEEKNEQYLADGVMNSIISHLKNIQDIKVIAKTSTEKYRNISANPIEIGDDLNVNYILDGSFQIIENEFRLSIGLISTIDGGTVWFEEYDRKWEDILKLQSDIANTIADKINVIITPEEKREIEISTNYDVTAYQYYLRGEEYRNRSFDEQNYRYSIKMYEKAVEIDPEYTLAWVGLAATSRYIYLFYYDRSEDHLSKTKKYLDKASLLSPNSKEVLLEEALYQYHCKFDYQKALQKLEKLKANYSNDDELYFWIGAVYRRIGEFKRSFENTNYAISMNPSEWSYWQSTGITLQILRKYKKAEEYYKKVIYLNPSVYEPYWYLANLYLLTGKVKKAKEFLEQNSEFNDQTSIILLRSYIEILDNNYEDAIKIIELLPDIAINQSSYHGTKNLQLGLIYYIMSNEKLAAKYFEAERIYLEEKIKTFNNDSRLYSSLGMTYAGLGMKEKAIENGKKAVEILGYKIDAHGGFYNEMDLTRILLIIGEYEKVLTRLEFLLNQNGEISIELLKIDPFWDQLEDMERFQEIISNPKYQQNSLDD